MKVLVISNLYPPFHIGGYEISCRDSVDLLCSVGIECLVLTSDFMSYSLDASALPSSGATVRRMLKLHEAWGTPHRAAAFDDVSRHNWTLIEEEIAKFEPDIIYTWNLHGLGALNFPRLSRRWRDVCVHHFMDLSLFPGLQTNSRARLQQLLAAVISSARLLEAKKCRRGLGSSASHVYASEFLRQAIQSLAPVERYIVLYPPIRGTEPARVKADFRLDRANVRCVYVGQIAPHKGVEVMLEGIAIAARTSLRITAVVYGNHVDRQYSEYLTARYGRALTILSHVSRERILRELPDYDIGVFPSTWQEPFGMAQLEMARAGLPILSSATGGAAEFGRHGITVLRFRPGDAGSLAETLSRLIADYETLAPILSDAAVAEERRMCDEHAYVHRLTNFFGYLQHCARRGSDIPH